MKKIYILTGKQTGSSKAILYKGFIAEFNDAALNGRLIFQTSSLAQMEAIEQSAKFINGEIELLQTIGKPATSKHKEETKETTQPLEDSVYEDVTTFKQAREILQAEPYNISSSQLRNAAMIFEKAEELGISFPSLPE